MTQIQNVPLAKLKASLSNTRKTGGRKVADLVASIAAHGLRHNLTVVETDKGYDVVAGGRRLRALQQLAKAGTLPAALADGVPCMIVDAAAAAEVSLAENTIREPMHPIDQFTAFQAMADAGEPTADIAARFGVPELVVRQRMRLSRVSPKLLKVYGEGGMTLEQLQAFAVSEDHERQESVWKRARGNEYQQRPEYLRRELASKEAGNDDPRVQLVTLAAYEAAGGRLRRDLFSDTVFVEDLGLLEQLVAKVLEQAAEAVRAEGWKWVEVGGDRRFTGQRIVGIYDVEQSEAEEAEHQALEEKSSLTLVEQVRLSELSDQVFTPEQKAAGGARVFVEPHGLHIQRGLLRDGDQAPAGPERDGEGRDGETDNEMACEICGCTQLNACEGGCYWVRPGLCSACAEEGHGSASPEKDPAAIPQRCVVELTLARTGAMRLALQVDPVKAITALTAHLAEAWLEEGDSSGIGIEMREGPEVSAECSAAHQHWQKRLASGGPVIGWLCKQPWPTTLDLLAFLVGESLDAVHRHPSQESGDELAAYLNVDMADRWRPDALFMQQLSSAAIFAALEEVGTDATRLRELRKLKKAQLAEHAAALLAPTRWVPACIRLS